MNGRVLYIPGLAANENLFNELQKLLPGDVPPWPQFNRSDDLTSYAEKCIKAWNVQAQDVLIGFSFGGMIAKEIRQLVPSKNSLFIISSCRNKDALDSKFIKRSKFLKYIPNFIFKYLVTYIGPIFTARTQKEREHLPILKSMAKETSLDFLKWATEASGNWRNTTHVELVQIHGEHDQVIPAPVEDPNHVIKGAAHLICYTHAKEIVQIYKEYQNV